MEIDTLQAVLTTQRVQEVRLNQLTDTIATLVDATTEALRSLDAVLVKLQQQQVAIDKLYHDDE